MLMVYIGTQPVLPQVVIVFPARADAPSSSTAAYTFGHNH